MSDGVIRLAIVGMGGFAGRHHQVVLEMEGSGEARLIATCDPNVPAFARQMSEWEFDRREVAVFDDYREMLIRCRERLDMVIISSPIHLHGPMHRACVELGLPVYLEKPPTLDPDELEMMIEADLRQAKKTSVPFNFIVERPRQELKKRILAGDFGRLERVSFSGVEPRATSYFKRSNWSGKLMMGDKLVLDSCMGNAMAHQVHNVLFWAGREEIFSWANIESVEAELYRAHEIQGLDTVFLAAKTTDDVSLFLFQTHAASRKGENAEMIFCENAAIRYVSNREIVIQWKDGRVEEVIPDDRNLLHENHRWFYAYLRGDQVRPLTTLEDSRPFVHLNSLAYLSSGKIGVIPHAQLERSSADAQTGEFLHVKEIESMGRHFLAEGIFPSEQGRTWASRAERKATIAHLPLLKPLIRSMAGLTP